MQDISSVLSEITQAGGAQIGEITDFGTADKPFLIAYARDPEGNVLELSRPDRQVGHPGVVQPPGMLARWTCGILAL
jgi:hypothetical protein